MRCAYCGHTYFDTDDIRAELNRRGCFSCGAGSFIPDPEQGFHSHLTSGSSVWVLTGPRLHVAGGWNNIRVGDPTAYSMNTTLNGFESRGRERV